MSEETAGPRLHFEDAVLDIGDDVGALILYTGADLREREVEIAPIDDADRRTHTAIHERRVGDEVVFAGIFAQLVAGEYRLWPDDPALPDRVTIVGGEITTLDWRAAHH